MNLLSLDLELNQPSQNIIEIGCCVFNPKTGIILEDFVRYIKINEPLNPDITTLTRITEDDLQQKGVSLWEAYQELVILKKKYQLHKQIVQWGDGDVRCLKNQIFAANTNLQEGWWKFGFRWFDTKTLSQAFKMSREQPIKGGLQASMEDFGLNFEGVAHDALVDARNTAVFFSYLLGCFRKN